MTNELRIKLAEALGYDGDGLRDYIKRQSPTDTNVFVYFRIPDFTRFDSGAALLVEHLRGLGWRWEAWTNELSGKYTAAFRKVNSGHVASGDSLPLAIVFAACKVLSIDTSAKG